MLNHHQEDVHAGPEADEEIWTRGSSICARVRQLTGAAQSQQDQRWRSRRYGRGQRPAD